MTTLIQSTEDLKEVNSAIVHDLEYESVQSSVNKASVELMAMVGTDTYDVLVVGGDGATFELVKQLAKMAEGNLAAAYYTNIGSVKLSENGAQVFQDSSNKIASDRKIAALVNQSLFDGYRAVDQLLDQLETNIDAFVIYRDSAERKRNRNSFINTTDEFNTAVFIGSNPLLFRSLKSYIRDAEVEHIVPLLGDEYAAGLRLKVAANELTPVEQRLKEHIAKVVAEFAIADAIPYRAVSIDANGVFTNTTGMSADASNTQLQQPAEIKRLSMAMTAAVCNGNKALARLRKFISKNKDALTGIGAVDLTSRSTLNDTNRSFLFV